MSSKEVAQLLSAGEYDLPVFLSYLKTFAVNGSQPEKAILLGILLQSLARFHTNGFSATMCLVPSHVQDDQSVEKDLGFIYELENLLSRGDFPRFWARWTEVKEHLPESFHFETRVRTSILESVAITMERISVARLATYLSVPADQVAKVVETSKSQGGEFSVLSVDAESVVFARTEFNHPEPCVSEEVLRFEDIVTAL